MKKISLYICLILLWCNFGYALDTSNVTNFFKTQNNPPTELFGIKLFGNISDYSQEKITFDELNNIYEDKQIPFFEKTKSLPANDIVTIKNQNFVSYYLYLNEKLQITGIEADNWDKPIQEDYNLQKCLLKRNDLVKKISNLYDLNINNFEEQNYIWSDTDDPEYDIFKNDIASVSRFKFNQNEITLIYSLSCYFLTDNNESVLYIDLVTEELHDALWNAFMSKSEKTVEQLLNKELKGL